MGEEMRTVCLRVLWTYGMPAVQFLQQGVVRAFRESALFIDKSQHAQFLRKEHTDVNTRALRRSEMFITVGHLKLH